MEGQEKGIKRQRSPNFPGYSLRECITFITKINEKYRTGEAHADDAIRQAGHSPTSSTAQRVLASLDSFGLIEVRGSGSKKFVKLSRLALEIVMEKEGSVRWIELLQQAALSDTSMLGIWERWGKDIPQEDTIQKTLILEGGYSQLGATRFAKVIVDTYDFAQLTTYGMKSGDEVGTGNLDQPSDEGTPAPSTRKANLLLRGKDRQVVIIAPDDLTEEEFDNALKWLQFQKFGLVQPIEED